MTLRDKMDPSEGRARARVAIEAAKKVPAYELWAVPWVQSRQIPSLFVAPGGSTFTEEQLLARQATPTHAYTWPYQPKEETMTDDAIEAEIQAKNLNAPRVTPKDIQDNILFEGYHSAWEGADYADTGSVSPDITHEEAKLISVSLSLVTICTIVLKNGFVSIGISACASPENFDASIGRKIARENALSDVWKVMGYALRTKLAGG